MFSHVMVGSNDLERSRKFYDALFGKPAKTDEKGRLSYGRRGAVFMVSHPINGEAATHGNGSTIGFTFDTPGRGRCLARGRLRRWRNQLRGSARLSVQPVRQTLPGLFARSRRQQAVRSAPARAMTIETVSEVKCHGGVQGVYRHASAETGTDMLFSIFVPRPCAGREAAGPVVPLRPDLHPRQRHRKGRVSLGLRGSRHHLRRA